MRKRLWTQFHLWTIALLALLTVANVASALRPYSSTRSSTVAPGIFIGDTLDITGRSPASTDEAAILADSRLALKTARISCDPTLRLKVVPAVRQIRLQFDACSDTDTIHGIQNKTNGFEATVFGTTSDSPEAMAGTFTTPEATALAAAKAAANPPKQARAIATDGDKKPTLPAISTDYISLAPGENEITIRRGDREQVLLIQRR